MKKFLSKKITDTEFAEALAHCAETAQKAYKRNFKYLQEVKTILDDLNSNLHQDISKLLSEKNSEQFEFSEILNDIIIELQKISDASLKDLKDAIKTKSKHLEDFTITLFGRTKAGKSTIRESITKIGDGSTIGLGYLHTTKEIGDYKWKGLRLLDTPGVEGYGGEHEAEEAHKVIDQSDVIIFLTTDDSQQPGEFDEMERLIEINKPFFVVLNIKDKITDSDYLKRFLNGKANLFNKEIIEEHKKRIITETKRLGIHNIEIIWISALASCIAQFAERGFNSHDKEKFLSMIQHPQIRQITEWFLNNLTINDAKRLWQLSQIEKLFERIAFEVNSRGKQRRLLTFYDSTVDFIDTIEKMLWENQHSIREQAKFMLKKKDELKKFFDKFIEESNLKIERKCKELFNRIKEWVPTFVDEYLGKDNAQDVLNQKLGKERNKIEKEMNLLMDEITQELQKELSEFYQQYQYDIGTIKLETHDIGNYKKTQISRIVKWGGVITSGVLVVVAVAWWNPAGWIAAGVGTIFGFLSHLLEKSEKKKWSKSKEEAKNNLWNNIDKMERKTRGEYKTWFYKNITTKGKREMLDNISIYIRELFGIAYKLCEYSQQLMKLREQINKDLFSWLLQLEGVECSNEAILAIAREQGFSTKIMIADNLNIDDKLKNRLEKLTGERILIFNDNKDLRSRVMKALYPANPSIDQIEIIQDNEKVRVKVKVPKDEMGIYIGKNHVNIRLAQQVCGVQIELIESGGNKNE